MQEIMFILCISRRREFLGCSWLKANKHILAPNITHLTDRFNHSSRLVASEIMSR